MFLHVFTRGWLFCYGQHVNQNKKGLCGRGSQETCGSYRDVRGTLDYEAVGETIKADGPTLLIQVDLLFRQKVGNSAASTKSREKKHGQFQLFFGPLTV